MAPIEAREPTKAIVRIELAAAFLATACSAAYDSAGPIGSPDSGPGPLCGHRSNGREEGSGDLWAGARIANL